LLLVAVVGILAPWIAHGPGVAGGGAGLVPWGHAERLNSDRDVRRLPPGSTTAGRGDTVGVTGLRPYTLGTDSLGQDVLSNLIHGCRSALLVGLAGAGTALLIGITLGAIMGYFGGSVDLLLMRIVEVFMSVPLLFFLVLGAAVLPREPLVIMGLIGSVTWTGVARLTRAEVMRVRGMDFVDAARASGLPAWRVVVGHVLPSAIAPALVEGAFLFAAAILFGSTLSFLNLGPVDRASWGRLLAQAAGESGDFAWWLAVFPGLCVVLTVLSCQTLGTAGRGNRAGGGEG
jgi:peptide/nickel transport system permease protein